MSHPATRVLHRGSGDGASIPHKLAQSERPLSAWAPGARKGGRKSPEASVSQHRTEWALLAVPGLAIDSQDFPHTSATSSPPHPGPGPLPAPPKHHRHKEVPVCPAVHQAQKLLRTRDAQGLSATSASLSAPGGLAQPGGSSQLSLCLHSVTPL